MNFTVFFNDLKKSDTDIAGGKGASLGEMTNAGIPVPEGFVVTAQTFDEFLKETDLNVEIDAILDDVDHNAVHTVEDASAKIQALILKAEMPDNIKESIEKSFNELSTEFVAVRSSATAEDGLDHAWAGQLDSHLNITKDEVVEHVQKCWSSLFTPRAIFYRFEKDLHKTNISVAVVVQKMVNSEKSGIAFSVHPVTEDRNQIIIEAGLGLGEAIVSGQITPDSYVVEKDSRNILDINVNTQNKALYRKENGGNEWKDLSDEEANRQVLTEEQIKELSELIIKIENHYNLPQDIEWAYENGKFYIVQSRPITTLSGSATNTDESTEDFQQLFQVRGNVSVLLSSLFINHYKHLEVLVYFSGSIWKSLLPKHVMVKTLDEGLELYKDKEKYEQFKEDLEKSYKEAQDFFKDVLKKNELTKDDVEKYLYLASRYFLFYQKTEFFYTDKAYEKQDEFPEIKENFKTFEEFKLKGRKYLNSLIFEGNCYLNQLVNKLSEQLNVPAKDLHLYTIEDIKILFDDSRLSSGELEQRREAFLMEGKGESVEYLWGNDAREKIAEFEKESDPFHLKGKVAYRGKAKGRAKVFNFTMDQFDELHKWINEMEEGQILVAESTAPEIISACKKASAIITNQGGMMSHAAIVARELKVPCIVGTGNATELIRNGQEIEVDADRGVVRIPEEEWIFMWASAPVLPSFYGSSNAQKHRPDIPFPSPVGFQYFDGEVITMYMPKFELERTKYEISPNLFLNEKDYKNFVKTFEKEYKDWTNWIEDIKTKDYSQATRKELLKDHKDFTSYQRDSVGYFGSTRTETNHAVEQKLERIVEEKFEDKWPEIFGILTTPLELDDIQKQQLDLARLSDKKDVSDKDLLEHTSEFPWLVFGQFDDKKVVEYVKSLVDDYDGPSHKEAVKRQEDEKKKIKEEQEKLYKQLSDRKETRHLATVLQEQAVRRMDIKDFWVGSYFLSKNLWEKIAEELSLDIWDFLKYIFPHEVQLLLGNEFEGDINKILDERKKSYAIYYSGSGDIQLLTAEEADTAFKNIVHQAQDVGEEIKGQTAVLGKYKGKVRKVMPGDLDALQKDTEAFQKGEVLVTTMTQPNMVPIMKKAGAVITDEGGITSHAAIVAREFKIPCIVGCLNAMQVLNDGDEIEVDADKSVVRIIK